MLLIPNQVLIFFSRFLQGICIGLYSAITPLIINEFSPTSISGTLGALNQFSIAFGVFFAYFLQYILMKINNEKQEPHWRIMFGFCLIPVVLQSIFLLLIYKF